MLPRYSSFDDILSRMTTLIEGALRRKLLRKLLRVGILLALISGSVYGVMYLAESGEKPQGEDRSTGFVIVGREHVAEGTKVETYNSNPPTSGPHYGTPARIGFYSRELPDERLVHNLEHGDVWISYQPDVPEAIREKLRAFLKDPKVIITMRAKNDRDIALVAWGRADTFDLTDGALDIARISDFILRYKNRGPERVLNSGDHLPQE